MGSLACPPVPLFTAFAVTMRIRFVFDDVVCVHDKLATLLPVLVDPVLWTGVKGVFEPEFTHESSDAWYLFTSTMPRLEAE